MSRVVPGVAMAACCVALLVWGTPLLISLFIALVAAGSLWEFFHMSLPSLPRQELIVSVLIALVPAVCAVGGAMEMVLAGIVISMLLTVFLVLKHYSTLENVYAYMSSMLFGIVYVSTSLAHMSMLAGVEHGAFFLLLLLAVTAGSDTGAYYIGKTFGHKKLLPAVSPKKTVAGAIGGIVCGTGAALLVNFFFLPQPFNSVRLFPAAVVLVIIGMIGDLAESAIKRSFHVKDSSTILAGHGGLLDRIDSLLFAGPVLFYFIWWGVLQ